MISKIIGGLILLFIVIWIVGNPAGAGNTVHDLITGLITFFQHLAK